MKEYKNFYKRSKEAKILTAEASYKAGRIKEREEILKYLLKLNTHYQSEDLNNDLWIVHESEEPTHILTEKELLDRAIGAVTVIGDIYNKIS